MNDQEAPDIGYEQFWYIKTISDTDKNPMEAWGGYDQDFEAAENVYSYEEVRESNHSYWGIVGIKGEDRALLMFDIDIYDAPDEFDEDLVEIPGGETLVVRSQSGGLHVWFVVREPRGAGMESDFEMTYDLGFDIDIRGSYVKHHGIAPSDIPGVDGKYEVPDIGAEPPMSMFGAGGPADRIRYLGDDESDKPHGEPLIEHTGSGSRGGDADIEIDRDIEPPEQMPTCYHRALQLRAANPDDPNINTHKVNVLAGLCGLAAGYDIDTMVDHFVDEYAPGPNGNRERTEYQLSHMARKMDDGEYAPPSISTLREYGVLDDDEMCHCSIEYHGHGDGGGSDLDIPTPEPRDGFAVEDGGYGVTEVKSNRDGDRIEIWSEWTNFQLELNAIVTTPEGDRKMSITVHPRSEPAYDIEIEPTVLNDVRSFKEEVCVGATTTFDGSNSDLTKIKQFVGGQDAPRKTGTRHMGYHQDGDSGIWVTPNGNIGPDGWVADSDLVLVEREIESERKWSLDPDEDSEYDRQNVVEMLELLPQTRDTDRLLPLLSWFYASATRPLIMDWTGDFNFASVTGGTGAGKTTTISTLWELMGMDSDPMSADTTEATLLTTFSSSNSIPMWFDEYKPSDMTGANVNQFNNILRKATRGGIGQRSNADLSNEGFPLHAPTVISGEERVQGTAEERRGIFTSFRKSTTESGTPTARAYAKLAGTGDDDPNDPESATYYEGYDYDEHALAWTMWVTRQDPEELKSLWRDSDEYVRSLLSDWGISIPGDLEFQALQTIRYGCVLYRQFYRDMGGDGTVITDDQIKDAIDFSVAGSSAGGNQRSHPEVLLDVASRAARADYLQEDDCYTFVHKGKGREELRINISTAFDLIKKYAREHEITEDLLNNKHDYDSRLRDEADNIDWLTCRSQDTPPIGYSIGIDTETAEEMIDGFGRWMWDEEVNGSQADEWQALADAPDGRVDITVEVTDSHTDTPDIIAEQGVLTDATRSVDYVIFSSDRGQIPRLEEGECYAIKGAKLGEHDGAPQIELDSGVREIKQVDAGFGKIQQPDPGRNSTITASATTDGGEVAQLTARVEQTIEEHQPAGTGMIAGIMLGQGCDYDPGEIENAIDTLQSKGRITDFGDGYEICR